LCPRSTVDQSSSSLLSRNVALVKLAIMANKNGKRSSYKLLFLLESSRLILDISKIRENWVTTCAVEMVCSTIEACTVDFSTDACTQIPLETVSIV
jgi:hypothetical protein